MKKRLTGIISMILSLLLSLTFFAGCNLVTTDSEKEMKQVVATVSINENLKDDIILSDLVMSYINGGYTNEQYYGYTREQNIDVLLEELISQRILIQSILLELEADSDYAKNTDKEVYSVLRYLPADKLLDAEYSAYSAFNTYIESFAEAEDDKYADSWAGDARTFPTGATNEVKEKTETEKQAYIDNGIDVSDTKAVSAVIKSLTTNGLLGDKYKETGDIEDVEYFAELKQDYYEQALIEIYEERLALEARKAVTYEMLEGFYAELYSNQESFTNAEFTEKLSSATVDDPMLYGAYGSYGYVHNLLLGINDEQTAAIKKITEDNKNISDADYALARKAVLDATVASDLRSSWLHSGYDVEERSGKLYFTGDYTFAKDSNNSLPFMGTYSKIKDADAEKETPAKYSATLTYTYNLNQFIDMMDNYLGGTLTTNTAPYATESLTNNIFTAKKVEGATEYQEKINELLFAFSTDSGSLNTYKGYVIKPPVDGTATEEYVKTFGDAGRILLSQGTSYVVVASDYGYHVMFYSELVKANTEYATLNGYLNSLGIDKGSYVDWKTYYEAMINDYEEFAETENYLYKLANTKIKVNVTNYQNETLTSVINKYRYEETGCVSIKDSVIENFFF